MGLNYPRVFYGSQVYKVYTLDLSTERTDFEIEFPFDATTISIIRNDAEWGVVKIRLGDPSNDQIPIPKVEPPISWNLVFATRKIYVSNTSTTGIIVMVVFG